jgi:hypothetical protein
VDCAVEAEDMAAALRGCLLEVTWDGAAAPQVRAPLGDFFGTAPGLNEYASLPSGVRADGTLYSHWVMPFAESATLRLTNHSGAPVAIDGTVTTGDYAWRDTSRHFHAGWRPHYDVDTRPQTDWTLLDAQGAGTYVGTVYHIVNPVINWWGEGDEKIYVDGEDFPSTFGTGTEDYFGYAWCWNEPFTHAYHNQVYSGAPGNFGHSCVSRYHILDPLPFKDALRFDMEVWHHIETEVDLAATVFYYGAPGIEHAETPFETAKLRLPEVGLPEGEPGVTEGEAMRIIAATGGEAGTRYHPGMTTAAVDPDGLVVMNSLMTMWHGNQWSGWKALWWQGMDAGDSAVFSFPSDQAGPHRVALRSLVGPIFGNYGVFINGERAGEPLREYNPDQVGPMTTFDLGVFDLEEGPNTLTVVLLAPDQPDLRYGQVFSVDYLDLEPAGTP